MKQLKNLSMKSLCVLLSVMTVLLSFPISTFAIEEANFADTEGITDKDIIELKEKREKSTKYFRLQDGSYMIAQYHTAVHYLDENNEWQDIDNTLSASSSDITTSNGKIKFAKKITGNETLFALHNGEQKLTLSLDGAIKRTLGTITNNESALDENATELQKMTELTKISASVKYEDILPETDLEYVINGSTIKENIIVKEKQAEYSYSFTMSLNNLTASLTEKGEIHITDSQSEELVYVIPAPVMWDSNMVTSDDVHIELQSHSNGKYTLTVVADSDWINAQDRAFPVTIDPPLYTDQTYSNDVFSTNVSSASPSSSSPTDSTMRVSSAWKAYWKLLYLPSLPSSAYITDAKFTMDCYTSSEMSGYVAVYDVMTDWWGELTWSQVTSSENPQGLPSDTFTDYQEIICHDFDGDGNYTLNNSFGYYWNVTPIVKKWYNGQNYGMMFAPATDTNFTGTANFYSNYHTTAPNKPQLCISYRDMKGTEDYWSYSAQSAGFAGTGSVNNATGNLVFSIPTLTSTDALMPITPSLVYNSALAGTAYKFSYLNVQTAYPTSYTPLGFKLNLGETLLKQSYQDENGAYKYHFILADSDGTEHYFLPANAPANISLTATQTYYEDEDGLMLYLIEDSSNRTCTITDSAKNVRTFSAMTNGWYLSSIADKSQNKVVIAVDDKYKPISVNLAPAGSNEIINQLGIAYNDDGLIYMVWNPTSHEAVIFRYSSAVNGATVTSGGSYLRQVVRAHGATNVNDWRTFYDNNANYDVSALGITVDAVAEYTYSTANSTAGNKAGLLVSATNLLTSYRLTYGYQSNRVTSITEAAGANGNEIGQALSLEYNATSTVIRTSGSDDTLNTADDLITTYCFDGEGRTISCYTTDLERTQIFGASNGQYVGKETEKVKNNLKSSVQTAHQSSNYLLNGGLEQTESNTLPYWSTVGSVESGSHVSNDGGKSCATLSVSASTATTSSISQTVSLSKGDYSLAVYVDTHMAPNVRVYLKAESLSNSAHSVVQEIATNEYSATSGFAFAGLNFTADPATSGGTESFKISVVLQGNPSEAEQIDVDNIMLSRTTGAAEYDALSMGHFESTGSAAPSEFWKILDYESTPITVVDSGVDAFGNVLKIDTALGEHRFVQQTIYFADDSDRLRYDSGDYQTPPPVLFTVSGWGKGTAQAYSQNSSFGIDIIIKYYDGSTYRETQWEDINFDNGITDWQFVSDGFATDPTMGLLESITVRVKYQNQPGVGYFDNISLVIDSSNTNLYEYYNSGYLDNHKNGYSQTWYQYDANNNVIRTISTDHTVIDYSYDLNQRVIEEIYKRFTESGYCSPETFDEEKVKVIRNTGYQYNAVGLVTRTMVYDSTANPLEATINYTEYHLAPNSHIYGTVVSETDSLGNVTRYFRDETNGRLLAVAYPEGNGVCYEYDGMGNLTQVLPATLNATADGYTENANSASVTYTYDEDTNRLEQITTESSTYAFVYDTFGNTDKIAVGTYELVDYDYHANNGKLNTLSYGNGLKVKYLYDILDRIEKIQYNIGENDQFVTVYSYTYDSAGNIFSVTDHVNDEVTMYKYDALGRLVKSYVYDEATYTNLYSKHVSYNEDSRISTLSHTLDYACPTGAYYDNTRYAYSYDNQTGNLKKLSVGGDYLSGTIEPVYDGFGRTMSKTIDFNVNSANAFYNALTYDYVNIDDFYQSARVSQMVSEVRRNADTSVVSNTTYNYTYDDNGNITLIKIGNVIQYKYYYDALGQLIREDNLPKNYSYEYVYDNAGNITAKKQYAFTVGTLGAVQSTTSYTYGDSQWGDLLTKFNSNTIEYDSIGNPIKIGAYNESSGTWSYWYELTWEGRKLLSYKYYSNQSGSLTSNEMLRLTYNADGIRTGKVSFGVEHKYYVDSSQIIAETWYEQNKEHLMRFVYDETGAPIGIKYRNSTYASNVFDCFFFEKNLQGDIVAIYNASGTKIGTYTYDAWGNVTTATSGGVTALERSMVYTYNPFRYRGYYYDTETGWYYLQSRYYNPSWGRFLNMDSVIAGVGGSIQGYNTFAYCFNNPVNRVDSSGHWSEWIEDAKNWVNTKIIQLTINTMVVTAKAVEDVINYDTNNQSETKVLQSNYFSSYKGVPVIRTNGNRSGSFGVIFLTRETNNRKNPEDVVRHEYGHTKQLEQLGIIKYALLIGLPSWQDWGSGDYYIKPWEITADIYGNVQSRKHSKDNIDRGFTYLEYCKVIDQLIGVFFE